MAFVLFRVFSLGIISCMIISFRSSMRNKQHTDIAHDVVWGIQPLICRLFYEYNNKGAVASGNYITGYFRYLHLTNAIFSEVRPQ